MSRDCCRASALALGWFLATITLLWIVPAGAQITAPPTRGPNNFQCGQTFTFFQEEGPPIIIVDYENCETGSVDAVGQAVLRGQSNEVTSMVTARIRDLVHGYGGPAQPFAGMKPGNSGYHGLSAGSPDNPFGVWADASGSRLRNNSAIGYDTQSVVALSGLDYFINDNWLIGGVAGYTNAPVGLKSIPGRRRVNGAVVGPYAAYIIDKHFSVDAQINYTSLTNGLMIPVLGVNSNYHGDRVTGAINGNAFFDIDDYRFTGFVSYSYSFEHDDGPNILLFGPLGRNLRLGMLKIGGEVGRVFGSWEIYMPLTFEQETTAIVDNSSRSALVVGGGTRYQYSDTVKFGLQVTTTEIKDHTQDLTISGNLSVSF